MFARSTMSAMAGAEASAREIGFNAVGVPHERWTEEHGFAPVKYVAHSRWRKVKPLGRTSNMALRQQSLKDHQQLEAGVPKISKIALVSPLPEIANAGGLLSYGPDLSLSRRSASLVDQIAKGS